MRERQVAGYGTIICNTIDYLDRLVTVRPQHAPASMNILFVHNNFPGQFRHAARALAADPTIRVTAIGSSTARPLPGVKLLKYGLTDTDVAATHPFARRFDLE